MPCVTVYICIMKLTLGFSPCPNDTFIFDAMVNGKIDTQGLYFDYVMEDVETLNRWAEEGKLDITKLSFNSFLHTVHQYALLHSGSALGKGVGPLLVSKKDAIVNWQSEVDKAVRDEANIDPSSQFSVAIPGKNTTANLLLSLAFPEIKNKTEIIFSEIENEVLAGNFDAGLIIHESRFTYAQKGLIKLIDLGDWWENKMNEAIPLGGIAIKRSLGKDVAATVDHLLKESLSYSWKNYPALPSFITENAQEMEEDVMRKHINLYVNEYTTDLGEEGKMAIETLFQQAQITGLIKQMSVNLFY